MKVIGGNDDEGQYGSILSGNECYYLVSYSSSKDHDCIDTSWHPASQNMGYNGWVIKIDTSGSIVWGKSYGGTGGDGFESAIINYDSTVVAVGTSSSNDYMISGGHGGIDVLVVKADKDGHLLWSKMLGGLDVDEYPTICANGNEGTLVSVNSSSTHLGPPSMGPDNWLFSLDVNGNTVTDKVVGGSSHDWNRAVLRLQNTIYCLGLSSSLSFTDGISEGRKGSSENAYITRINYFPTAISNLLDSKSGTLIIYPNPGNDKIMIEVPGYKNGVLKIADSKGEKTFKQSYKNNTHIINLNIKNYPAGICTACWMQEDGAMYNGQFIKQ